MSRGTSFSQSTRFATCKAAATNHKLCSKGAKICYDKTPTLLMNEPPAPMPHAPTHAPPPHPAHFEIGRVTLAQKQIWENQTCMRGFSGKKWGRAGTYADRSLCAPQPHLNHTSTTPPPHLDHTSTAQTTTPQPHLHHISTTRPPPNR